MEKEKLLQEITYRTSRSSGAGGQNVNKVETKVDLLFDLAASKALSEEEIARATISLQNKLTKEGLLIVSSQKSRSQLGNKEDAEAQFLFLMEEALRIPKKRKKVKPLTADREKRLDEKKQVSEKKSLRKRVEG